MLAWVDAVSQSLKHRVSHVDDFVVSVSLEDGQDPGEVGGAGVAVQDHGQGGNPDLMVILLVGKDWEKVVISVLHNGFPS